MYAIIFIKNSVTAIYHTGSLFYSYRSFDNTNTHNNKDDYKLKCVFKNTLLKIRMGNVSSFIWWLHSPPSCSGWNKVSIYVLYENVLLPPQEYYKTHFNTGCTWITKKALRLVLGPLTKEKPHCCLLPMKDHWKVSWVGPTVSLGMLVKRKILNLAGNWNLLIHLTTCHYTNPPISAKLNKQRQ